MRRAADYTSVEGIGHGSMAGHVHLVSIRDIREDYTLGIGDLLLILNQSSLPTSLLARIL